MSNTLQSEKKLAELFIEREQKWDSDSILELRTDDCTYEIVPSDLELPKMDNEATKQFYDQLKPVWSDYKIEVLSTIHDAEQHTCAIHIKNIAGSSVGPFNVETVWWLNFTSDGTKIKKVLEIIIDSRALSAWLEKLHNSAPEQSN